METSGQLAVPQRKSKVKAVADLVCHAVETPMSVTTEYNIAHPEGSSALSILNAAYGLLRNAGGIFVMRDDGATFYPAVQFKKVNFTIESANVTLEAPASIPRGSVSL